MTLGELIVSLSTIESGTIIDHLQHLRSNIVEPYAVRYEEANWTLKFETLPPLLVRYVLPDGLPITYVETTSELAVRPQKPYSVRYIP